jgi:hypothetical protein
MSPRAVTTSHRTTRLEIAVAAFAAAAIVACQGTEQPQVRSVEAPVVAESAAPAEGPDTVEPASTPAVDWSAAAAYRQLDPGLLPEQAREPLSRIEIPALLPSDAAALAGAVITVGRGWYGAHLPLEGATLYLQGTLDTHPAPAGAGAVEPADGVRTTRAHGIVTSSFRAFGVAYTVHLECASPFEDPRCVDDAFVDGLVAGLAVAGGRQ